MHVGVEVSAGDPKDGRYAKTTHCMIVFVVLDSQGRPVEIERWVPKTEEEVALKQYAKRLMGLRKGIEEEARLRRAMLL